MKGRRVLVSVLALGLMLALAAGLGLAQEPGPQGDAGAQAVPVGTSFTYQGRLTDGGEAANGAYDFEFELYDDPTAGSQVTSAIAKNDVTVTDGLFTVELDFGYGVFAGDDRWLEIGVRVGSSTGAYTTLTSRQALTATPYALHALSAPWSGLTGVPPEFDDGVDNDTTYTAGAGLNLVGTAFSADTTYLQRRVSDTCGAGNAIRAIDEDGAVTCEPDDDTTYTAGTGLNLVGTAFSADTTYLQRRVSGTCGSGNAIRVIDEDGAVTCEPVGNGVGPHDHWGETWSGSGVGLTLNSSDEDALRLSGGDDGLQIESAADDGVFVQSAGEDGILVDSPGRDGVSVVEPGSDGFYVRDAGDDGLGVASAADRGVQIDAAGSDGVYVASAGSPDQTNPSAFANGFEVGGADWDGLHVGWAGENGVDVYRAGFHGFGVTFAGTDGLHVNSADDDGVDIRMAGTYGVYVADAGADGVYVRSAGEPPTPMQSLSNNGLEVAGAQGYGLFVGRAGLDAVHVYNAWQDGIHVESANDDGIHVEGASDAAGEFWGDVYVSDHLSKGSGTFKIDHPLDPENEYLYHSMVESPDMMNIYNGNVTLDTNGGAWVDLPAWFEALNRDFRYQLTAIGAPGPNLYVAQEITGNRFQIAGGQPGLKVSWQVTGVRRDAYAEANRIPVEEQKPPEEQGTYLHPEAFGKPETMGLLYREAQARRPAREVREEGSP